MEMAFYHNRDMPPLSARIAERPQRRAEDRPVLSRMFYNLRKIKNHMKKAPAEEHNILPVLQETITPVALHNAFSLLHDAGDIVNDEQIDIVLSETPKKVKDVIKKVPKAQLNARLATVDENGLPQTSANFVEHDVAIEDRFEMSTDRERVMPAKRIKREYRKAVAAVVKSDMYYYMKIKYFMKERTPGMVQQIINDCRVYLTKSGSLMNTKEDYELVSSLVLAIWLPSREELRFRSAMKNDVVLDGIEAINQFNKGNLGNRFSIPIPSVSRPSLLTKQVTINPKQ